MSSQPDSLSGASPVDNEAWAIPWYSSTPLGSSVDIPNHCVLLAPAIQMTSRYRRKAYWRNEKNQWVKFVFTLEESELIFFDETPKSPRMICQSHPGRVNDGVSARTSIFPS